MNTLSVLFLNSFLVPSSESSAIFASLTSKSKLTVSPALGLTASINSASSISVISFVIGFKKFPLLSRGAVQR